MSSEATPAKPPKPVKQYTEESISNATKEILEGQPQRATARKYNVPLTTIRDRVKAIKVSALYGIGLRIIIHFADRLPVHYLVS